MNDQVSQLPEDGEGAADGRGQGGADQGEQGVGDTRLRGDAGAGATRILARLPWFGILLAAALAWGAAAGTRQLFPDRWHAAEARLAESARGAAGEETGARVGRPGGDVLEFAPKPPTGPAPVRVALFSPAQRGSLVSWPPGPLDYAVVWQGAAALGPRVMVLADPGQAERGGAAGLERRALESAVARAGVPAVRAADLGSVAVPAEGVEAGWDLFAGFDLPPGSSAFSDLPEVNEVLAGEAGAGWADAFSRIAGREQRVEDGEVVVPVLARAGGRVLVHAGLAAWAAAADMDWSAVAVSGSLVAPDGRALPVDKRGEMCLPMNRLERIAQLDPLEIVEAPALEGEAPAMVVLGHVSESGAGSGDERARPHPAMLAAAIFSALWEQDAVDTRLVMRRLDPTALGLLIALGVVAALLVATRPWPQAPALAALVAAGYVLFFIHSGGRGFFHDAVLVAAVWLAALSRALAHSRKIPDP